MIWIPFLIVLALAAYFMAQLMSERHFGPAFVVFSGGVISAGLFGLFFGDELRAAFRPAAAPQVAAIPAAAGSPVTLNQTFHITQGSGESWAILLFAVFIGAAFGAIALRLFDRRQEERAPRNLIDVTPRQTGTALTHAKPNPLTVWDGSNGR